MDDERFILEVEKHTVLYDTSSLFYKDNSKKDKAWSLIAGVVGVDVDVCRAWWKTLRDAFVKNRKNKSLASGSAGGSQKDWKYSEIMSFLLPHLQPRSSKSSLQLQADNVRSDSQLSYLSTDERSSTPGIAIQKSMSVSLAPSLAAATTSEERERPSRSRSPRERMSTPVVEQAAQEKRRSHRPQTTDIGERLMSLLQEPVPKPHMPDTELDESYHFALSLVPMLYRLDKDRRQQAKIEILHTLNNLGKAQNAPPQHAAVFHPPQAILGHSNHNSRPTGFQPYTFPPQSTHWEDESTEGSRYRDL